MNLQQLEYIIAVDNFRHFANAAEKSHVTQPTLSMMIQKLEEELDVKIFDRSKQPVEPTEIGKKIIEQAKLALKEVKQIKEMVDDYKGEIKGELRIGVIPTLAPYLMPLFIKDFVAKYPRVFLKIEELTTNNILERLATQQLDIGILATPLSNSIVHTEPLFYEQFVLFGAMDLPVGSDNTVDIKELDLSRMWLLEEGHCLRSQVVNLCDLRQKQLQLNNIDYQSGSIETLKRMVEATNGITILPELALQNLNEKQKQHIRHFQKPVPAREISLVTYRYEIKRRLIGALKDELLLHIPETMKHKQGIDVMPVEKNS